MSQFKVDYNSLHETLYKKAYKLSEVSSQVEKVAFDIVRFKDGDKAANLWQIQSADDGEYIVALYQPDETEKKASSWNVEINKVASDISIFYKGEPIIRLASSKLGIPKNELDQVSSYLPEKLASNKKLVSSLFKLLSPQAKSEVLKKYPELG